MPEPVWYQNKGTKSGTGLRCWNVDADEFGLDADAQLWFSNFFVQPAFEDLLQRKAGVVAQIQFLFYKKNIERYF